MADTRPLFFTSVPKDKGMKILGNPDINLVITSDIPEALFSERFKTRISQYIKHVTETKYHSDALKNLLDRFQFPVTILYSVV